jgi:RimJ/RimL family protein N-acetyltransferase
LSVILHTQRLVLDELETDRDADFILALLNEPGFLENIGDRGVRDLAGARAYLAEGPRAAYAGYGYGRWRATERAGGRPVGLCGLVKRDGLKDPDLGYAFLASVWGRGYASEAARASLDHARRNQKPSRQSDQIFAFLDAQQPVELSDKRPFRQCDRGRDRQARRR